MTVGERAREPVTPSLDWLVRLLWAHDPSCGFEDCQHTASRLWPHIEAALSNREAVEGSPDPLGNINPGEM